MTSQFSTTHLNQFSSKPAQNFLMQAQTTHIFVSRFLKRFYSEFLMLQEYFMDTNCMGLGTYLILKLSSYYVLQVKKN